MSTDRPLTLLDSKLKIEFVWAVTNSMDGDSLPWVEFYKTLEQGNEHILKRLIPEATRFGMFKEYEVCETKNMDDKVTEICYICTSSHESFTVEIVPVEDWS